ncbi:MAG: hypothetical protein LBM08_00675 [Dysgonamonadaceae bacterium]|jgi:hypothetical protein|nr:hypothetical protein [Dysgonamonadaceae bacterium]
MKKIIVAGILYFFLIPAVFFQNGEYVGGASFTKRIEYNLIMLDEVYNLRSKGDVEKLFFGDFNALVEFFYKPSFSSASGFRLVKDSSDKSCTLEIKYVLNYKEALKEADKSRRQRTVPAPESRTDVKSINKMQSGQGNLLEKETPKDLLPP